MTTLAEADAKVARLKAELDAIELRWRKADREAIELIGKRNELYIEAQKVDQRLDAAKLVVQELETAIARGRVTG